jgi:hypothetical protein
MASATEVFSNIFHGNAWKGESRSGPGSTHRATEPLRAALPQAFLDLNIRTLVDAPCGTAEWITSVTDTLSVYLGFDIVPDLIAAAARGNVRRNHFFMTVDITTTILPEADAIFCRDCLVHFPLATAKATIDKFRASGSIFLMTTTFPEHSENNEIPMGAWRPLNLQAAPFDLPAPIMMLPDRVWTENDPYRDKSIGVWRLADL